jgi:hypothetical protein
MSGKKLLGIALIIFLSVSIVDAQEVVAKRQKDVNDISVAGIELSERQKQLNTG